MFYNLNGLVDLSGRHSWSRGLLRMHSRTGGSIVFAPGIVASLDLNVVSRSSESKTKSYPLHRSWRQTMRLVPLCGQCTRWQIAGRPGRKTNTGHRDKISGGSAPLAWPRSVRQVRLQLVGDQFFQLPTACRRSTRVLVRRHSCLVVVCSTLVVFYIWTEALTFLAPMSLLLLPSLVFFKNPDDLGA